jgi:hypothetical protein
MVDRDAQHQARAEARLEREQALSASSAARHFAIGFMALVRTRTSKPRRSASSTMAMNSGFMNGSPPVKAIWRVGRSSAAISSR